MRTYLYILTGYLLGSILFANIFMDMFHEKGAIEESKDKNPGTANAFLYGGFWCGLLTLVCDLSKGILPVHLFLRTAAPEEIPALSLAAVLAAPVLGHVCSIFHHFKGGKGIAVTFGCLLGLFPDLKPALMLAFFFLFYSLILRIIPHFYRTFITYFCTLVALLFVPCRPGVRTGFFLIAIAVMLHLHFSKEEREKFQVKLLWMH